MAAARLLIAENVAVPLPDVCRDLLAPYAGKPITLGVRPEHVRLGTECSVLGTQYPETSALFTVAATVTAVERLGAETHVHLAAGKQAFIARIEGSARPTPGAEVVAAVSAEHLRFFDAVTEEAL